MPTLRPNKLWSLLLIGLPWVAPASAQQGHLSSRPFVPWHSAAWPFPKGLKRTEPWPTLDEWRRQQARPSPWPEPSQDSSRLQPGPAGSPLRSASTVEAASNSPVPSTGNRATGNRATGNWANGNSAHARTPTTAEPARQQPQAWQSESSPGNFWVHRSQLGWAAYTRPWPRLPEAPTDPRAQSPVDLSTGEPAWGAPAHPSKYAEGQASPTPDEFETEAVSWNVGARAGWGGTPPAEVRYGIRIMPGYQDRTEPPPLGRPVRWRYVQAELSALFADFTGFGLSASMPFDESWYGRLSLRFGDLFSERLDSDQCELLIGYRWPRPAFDLWGEAYAELGIRVGEIDDESATGPRVELGHRARVADALELQVGVGFDASLPDALHAEELYLLSQLELALDDRMALRVESELADASVFRLVLRQYW